MRYAALFTCVLVLFCSSTSEDTYTVEVVDGVRYVHNHAPLWGDTPKVKLEFVQKIGKLEGEDENYIFSAPVSAAADAEGYIYVSDMLNHRIRKYDPDGRYSATIGRRGQGPGEFNYPGLLERTGDSLLYVQDAGNNRIQVFDPSGNYVDQIRIPGTLYEFGVLSSGGVIVCRKVDGAKDSGPQYLLHAYGPDGALLLDYFPAFDYGDRQLNSGANMIFLTVGLNNYQYVSEWHGNRLFAYSPEFEPMFVADFPVIYEIERRVSREDRTWIDGKKYSTAVTHLRDVTGGIACDGQGQIWIDVYNLQPEKNAPQTRRNPAIRELKIFNSEGVLLGSIPKPAAGQLYIYGSRLFLCDDVFSMSVYEYRIVDLED